MKTKEEILRETASGIYAIPADYPESLKELREAILKAMQLYSDQQNKELRESMDRGIEASQRMVEGELLEKDAEIQRLTKDVDELRETKVLRDAYANKIERQNLRIEILKKDVVTLDSEITRLRELLGGSKDLLLVASTGYPQIEFLERVKKLITEIDNELNPKP